MQVPPHLVDDENKSFVFIRFLLVDLQIAYNVGQLEGSQALDALPAECRQVYASLPMDQLERYVTGCVLRVTPAFETKFGGIVSGASRFQRPH